MLNIQTISELAALLETTEERFSSTLRRVNSFCLKLSITDLERPHKKPREVYDPCGALRTLQGLLYQKVLLPRLDRHPNSHGGVPERNQLTCVLQHASQRFVYSGDIKNFFPGIHFERVRGLFLKLGCSAEVARALTRLCTNRYRLEQGFITSPILADRIFRPADERIKVLCDKHGLTYTRYVDDIMISSPFNIEKSGIPKTIARILSGTGFRLNRGKDSFGSITAGHAVLGLKLNKGHPDVSTAYYDETIRRLKNAAALENGGDFKGTYWTKNELFGRLRYICWVNPNRRKTLIPCWRSLNWGQIETEALRRGITMKPSRFSIRRG